VSVTAIANSSVGTYAVTASLTGSTSSAVFALTNVSGIGALLSFAQQPQNTSAGATMAPVVVRLTDNGGNPLSGSLVTLSVQGGTGSLAGILSASTDASGLATFSNLSINATGTYQLVASSGGLWVLSSIFQIGPASGRTIAVFQGNTQSASAGDPYAAPLKVVVNDGLGNPVSGAQVTFAVPTSGASVTFAGSPTVTTGSDGLATSPIMTANSQPGIFHVTATTPQGSAPATFDLQNLSATASRVQFVQPPTDTVAGSPVSPAVTVQIVDRFGNPVSQAGVSINLLLSSATAVSGGLTGGTAQTNSSGVATFPNLSIARAGSYQLLSLATGFESVLSTSFNVTGGPPGSLITSSGTPQSTTIRTVFTDPLVALVTDSVGNPLTGAAVTFTAPAGGPSGSFAGNTATATVVTDINGRAVSPVFTANNLPGTFSVTASVPGVTSRANFVLANLAPAASVLVFLTQPSNAVAGAAIGPPVRVQIQDGNGQPTNVSGVAIVITLSQGSGSLSGTLVQLTDANGIAVFNDLSIDLAGPKVLRALGGAQTSAQSSQFQISAGSASSIVAFSGSGQIVSTGEQFPAPLQALVADTLGNPVSGATVTFALPASGPSGTFGGTPTSQTGANGIATSPPITANNTQGTISVTASLANGTTSSFTLAILRPSGGSLRSDTTVMQFTQAFGGPPPSSQAARLTSISGSEISWTAHSSAAWLTVNPVSGITPGQIQVSANGAGLAPGQYGGLVTISDTSGDQQTIFVSFAITAPASLIARPSSLAFVSVVGSDNLPRAVSSQTIELTSANSSVAISYQTVAEVHTPAGGKWLSVSPNAGTTPGAATVTADPTGLSAGIFTGVITFTPNDITISPVSVPVTLVVGCGASACPTPPPAALSITNSASFHAGGSPGEIQTIFGSYLAGSIRSATTYPLPTSLAGSQVLVNGTAVPLFFVSPGQINFQMPSAATGSVRVEVATGTPPNSALTLQLTAVQPGLFVYQNLRAKALNQDLTLHTPQTPIPAGNYVVLYLTGMGPTTPPVPDGQPAPFNPLATLNGRVQVTIGGLPANVSFAGLTPGLSGTTQVNAQIPSGLAAGDQPVFVTVNGVPSNAGLITVK
jgi:adhesin/invasin